MAGGAAWGYAGLYSGALPGESSPGPAIAQSTTWGRVRPPCFSLRLVLARVGVAGSLRRVYVLKSDAVKEPLKAAQAIEEAFKQHPHWQTSEHQEQDVRRAIYKSLIHAGVEAVVEVATKLMRLLRRASP